MREKSERHRGAADRTVKDIRRKTRKRYYSEDKIRIVLAGLRGEDSIAELCRQNGIARSQYYSWSKEFMEPGRKRLSGDTAREATNSGVPPFGWSGLIVSALSVSGLSERCLLALGDLLRWQLPLRRNDSRAVLGGSISA